VFDFADDAATEHEHAKDEVTPMMIDTMEPRPDR